MAYWYSIEVLDGTYSAAGWTEAFGDSMVTEALATGATNWDWQHHTWGAVFEVEFDTDEAWTRFQASITMQRALDAVPDPVSGLIIYRGRGGNSGRGEFRRPRPIFGSGAAALPLPLFDDEFAVFPLPVTQPLRLTSIAR